MIAKISLVRKHVFLLNYRSYGEIMDIYETCALTEEQVDFFKKEGYLLLPNFLDDEYLQYWRSDIGNKLRIEPHILDCWEREHLLSEVDLSTLAKEHSLRNLPRMQSILARFGCGAEGGHEQHIHRPGCTQLSDWKVPDAGHIDLIFQAFHRRFKLGATTYLHEVKPGGGAFCIWPGSHLRVWEFFQNNPNSYFTGKHETARHDMERQLNSWLGLGAPVEFVAKPKTLLLWHPFILHSASVNVNREPRLALFYRWGQTVPEGERLETFGPIWEHWGI